MSGQDVDYTGILHQEEADRYATATIITTIILYSILILLIVYIQQKEAHSWDHVQH